MNWWESCQFIQIIVDQVEWTPCVRMTAEDDSGREPEEIFRMSEPTSLLGENLETFRLEDKPKPDLAKQAPAKRLKSIDRTQCFWGAIDIEKLIGEDHPARAIWAMVNQLDLRRLEGK